MANTGLLACSSATNDAAKLNALTLSQNEEWSCPDRRENGVHFLNVSCPNHSRVELGQHGPGVAAAGELRTPADTLAQTTRQSEEKARELGGRSRSRPRLSCRTTTAKHGSNSRDCSTRQMAPPARQAGALLDGKGVRARTPTPHNPPPAKSDVLRPLRNSWSENSA